LFLVIFWAVTEVSELGELCTTEIMSYFFPQHENS